MMHEKKYIFKFAETADEMRQYYQVRQLVFVEEQNLFQESDRDEYDSIAIPIIAVESNTGKVVGTVRCYPLKRGIWIGGRLAVRREYRGRIGAILVRTAVRTMLSKKCKEFYAYVQIQNLHFFERLGWNKVGETSIFCGVHHELMQIDMAGVEGGFQGEECVRSIAIEKCI